MQLKKQGPSPELMSALNKILTMPLTNKPEPPREETLHMKLIFCPDCSDVRALSTKQTRFCECGKSWGKYTDNLNAEIAGKAIPIGFTNNSFVSAIHNQPEKGMGENFVAFIIPKKCNSIVKK